MKSLKSMRLLSKKKVSKKKISAAELKQIKKGEQILKDILAASEEINFKKP